MGCRSKGANEVLPWPQFNFFGKKLKTKTYSESNLSLESSYNLLASFVQIVKCLRQMSTVFAKLPLVRPFSKAFSLSLPQHLPASS
jgi:hypothetical protein